MLKKILFMTLAALATMVVLAVGLLLWPLPGMPDQGLTGDFVIRKVDVLDVRGGVLLRGQNVVVQSGLISSVDAAEPTFEAGALLEIDGQGKFLIPGLWDMHTHSTKFAPQYYHPLLIANGVTGVREMWGCMSEPDSFIACIDDRRQWNAALDNHSGLSPRFLQQGSFQINGGNEVPAGYPGFFKVRDVDDAREIVDFYAEAGVDFLKTYSELSPTAYHALAAEARRRGLFLAGHRPLAVSLEEMLAAGQRTVEHPRLFLFECYRDAAAFRESPDPLAQYDAGMRRRLVDQQDAARCVELMQAMADSGTWWVPTLQVLKMSALAADESFRADPRLKYIPYLIRQGMWMPDADRAAGQAAVGLSAGVYQKMYRMALAHVGKAHAEGVKILVGTDAGDTYIFPGFGVHQELAELVAAGLSPAEAIKAATIDAAIFSGEQQDYGSIEVGKVADMVLLDGNPLADINNTQRISGLLFNNRYYNRADLDRLLEFAEVQAGSFRTNLQLLWAALSSPIVRVQLAD